MVVIEGRCLGVLVRGYLSGCSCLRGSYPGVVVPHVWHESCGLQPLAGTGHKFFSNMRALEEPFISGDILFHHALPQ